MRSLTLILTGAAIAGSVALAPTAAAAPLCEHRSAAHISEHGGQAEDDRWHIARGELPNCDKADDKPAAKRDDDQASSKQDDGRKSRYCRKNWYC